MKIINTNEITLAIANMCIEACTILPDDTLNAIKNAEGSEKFPLCKEILGSLIENAKVSKERKMPLCQDTGMAIFFIEIGHDVHVDGDIDAAINEGVAKGYSEGYLRKSVVADPLRRVNTGDNTPAIVHYSFTKGDKIKITFAPKGFGSENMSAVKMLKPSDGVDGVIDFVVDTVDKAGSNPCPPIVVGVGIGGTMEKAAILSKHALTRDIGSENPDTYYSDLEKTLLEKINRLGIGAQGFGGSVTALCVNIETYPTHIAGLPVAVNINCHVSRHKTVIIG